MKQLIAYLLDHAIIDFSGDLTLDIVRDFLRDDDSPEGRKLLGKLVEDRGVDDMVVTLADCLQDYLRTGITDDVVREQIASTARAERSPILAVLAASVSIFVSMSVGCSVPTDTTPYPVNARRFTP